MAQTRRAIAILAVVLISTLGHANGVRAQNLTGKPTGVAVDIWANVPKCQIVYVLFDPATTYLGQPISHYRLHRNGHIVNDVIAASIAKSSIKGVLHYSLPDARFEPASGIVNSYQVSVKNNLNQTSPLSDAVTFRPVASQCNAAINLKTVVVVPALPVGVAPQDVVSAVRLNEVFTTSPTSASSFFKEVSITNGVSKWSGPDVTLWPQQQLPKSIAEYTANGASIDTTITPDLAAIRNKIQATNPSGFSDARASFVFVVMGAPAGGSNAASLIRVSGSTLQPGQPLHAGVGTIVHELGHRLGLQHASSFSKTSSTPSCTSSPALPFGSDPLSSLRDCAVATYDDRTDAMSAANIRPYGAFGRSMLFGHAPVRVAQTTSPKTRNVRLYASSFVGSSPLGWGGANAQDVWFRLDVLDPTGASYYVLEYRNGQGFSNTAITGDSCAFAPGVYAQFRPGVRLPPGDIATSQTFVPSNGCANLAITGQGQTKTFDQSSGLTVKVTNLTPEFVDIVLTWK